MIGRIIENGKVISSDMHGRWLVKHEKQTYILKNEYIPPSMTINRNNNLTQLIIVGRGKKRFYVAINNYMNDLIKYFFNIKVPLKIIKENWKNFFSSLANISAKNFFKNFDINGPFSRASKVLNFYKLKSKEYVIPVVGYKDIVHVKGTTMFYPGTIYRFDEPEKAVYKVKEPSYFPKSFKANICGRSLDDKIISKEVIILMHGFRSPSKWHYDIWQHVIGDNNYKKCFGINQGVDLQVFNQCKMNTKNNSCDEEYCVSKSLFQGVHSKIENLCYDYLNQIVTFFPQSSISKIKIYKGVLDEFNELDVACYIIHKCNKHLKLIFRGKCFNWNDQKPVLHSIPITMYLTDVIKPIEKHKRKKLIFDGKLKEIKNENSN